jgi:hypothetical protein
MKEINIKLLQFLNLYIPYIDSRIETRVDKGGEGYFSLELHKMLNIMGIAHEIVYIKRNLEAEKKAKYVNDSKEVLRCAIRFKKGLMVNCKGIMEGSYSILTIEPVTEAQLIADLADDSKWDEIFDKDQIEPIQKYIEQLPYDYGDFLSDDKEFPLAIDTKLSKKTSIAMELEKRKEIINMLKGKLGGGASFLDLSDKGPEDEQ